MGLCVVFLFGMVYLSAAAQGSQPTIQQATLRLWPEYDDPGLLVIFGGNLTNTASFPVQMSFPLPEGARGVQATAPDASGALITQDWQTAGGKLTYALPRAAFHVEYYLDRPPTGNQRELSYTFVAPYAIQSLEISVQQPARSTGFTVTPQPANSFVDSDGLTYYRINRANLASGDKVPIVIRYTKSDSGFSVNPAQQQSSQQVNPPASQPSAASAPGVTWLPYALIGLGVVILAGAAVYWLLQRRQTPAPAGRSVRASAGGMAQPVGRPGDKAVFCTQCGRPLKPEDRFCANCGTPRKG